MGNFSEGVRSHPFTQARGSALRYRRRTDWIGPLINSDIVLLSIVHGCHVEGLCIPRIRVPLFLLPRIVPLILRIANSRYDRQKKRQEHAHGYSQPRRPCDVNTALLARGRDLRGPGVSLDCHSPAVPAACIRLIIKYPVGVARAGVRTVRPLSRNRRVWRPDE